MKLGNCFAELITIAPKGGKIDRLVERKQKCCGANVVEKNLGLHSSGKRNQNDEFRAYFTMKTGKEARVTNKFRKMNRILFNGKPFSKFLLNPRKKAINAFKTCYDR